MLEHEGILRKIIREEIRSILLEEAPPIESPEVEPDLRTEITNVMRSMGMKAHLSGYRYLRDAVEVVSENPSALQGMCKVLYPKIAEKYGATPGAVERGIRHSVVNASHTSKLFAGKPTNAEVIATIAEHVRVNALVVN